MVKETYMNTCWVCGKPIGTWNEEIEVVCLECIEATESTDKLFEKRSNNISRPSTF